MDATEGTQVEGQRPGPEATERVQETRCRNCEAMLVGPYCAECGQEVKDFDVSIGPFVRDVAEGLVSLDSRAVSTMRILFTRPGGVTAEYVGGRRARFVPPVRLYLFVSVLYFLTLAWTTDPSGMIVLGGELSEEEREQVAEAFARAPIAVDSALAAAEIPDWPREAAGALQARIQAIAADPGRLWASFLRGASYLMFFLVPVFGVLIKGHYRRDGYLLQHLIFSIHFHTFVFAVLLLRHLASLAHLPGLVLTLLTLAIPGYLGLALHRVYPDRLWKTLLKAASLVSIYGVMLAVGLIGLGLLLIFTG